MFYSSRVGTGAKAEREAERRGNISCHGGRKGLQRKRKRAKEDGGEPSGKGQHSRGERHAPVLWQGVGVTGPRGIGR